MLHVPKDPIQPKTEKFPDIWAAAAVCPHVIRNPKLTKFNATSHVIKEIGSYSGMSSFSLLPYHRLEPSDLGHPCATNSKTKLLYEQRPEVKSCFESKFPETIKENSEIILDKKYEVSKQKVNEAKYGSSYISLEDSYIGWRELVGKDDASEIANHKLSCFVHETPTDEEREKSNPGRGPIRSLKIKPKPDEHNILFITCILQHSPTISWTIMQNLDLSNAEDKSLMKVLKSIRSSMSFPDERLRGHRESNCIQNLQKIM